MRTVMDLLQQLHPDFDYGKSEDFISDGLIDSVDLQELFAMIEKEYDIELVGTDLAPQNFKSIESITDLLAAHDVEMKD